MSYRLSLAASLLASLVLCLPVVGQETPITKLEPIRYQSGFIRSIAQQVFRVVPREEYHSAGVQVVCLNTNGAGSGSVVQTDKGLFALTNHHVIEGSPQVELRGLGGSQKAQVVWSSREADVAVIYAPQNRLNTKGLPIYNGPIPYGQKATVISFGGPGRLSPVEDIRPHEGIIVQSGYSAPVAVDAYSVSGDSGSAITYNKALIGVNWGHYGPPSRNVPAPDGKYWPAGKPLASNVDGKWLAKTLTAVCDRWGCRPVIVGQPVYSQPQPTPQPQPVPQPQPQQSCECDLDALKQQIADQLRQDPSLQGPPGPAGKDGKDGSDGAAGRDAVLTPGMIEQAVADYLAANPQAISLVLFDENGNEIDRDTTTIGGELKLQFFEVQ